MRTLLFITIVFGLLAGCGVLDNLTAPAAPEIYMPPRYTSLYACPQTGCEVTGTIRAGYPLTVIERTPAEGIRLPTRWLRVEYGDERGYVGPLVVFNPPVTPERLHTCPETTCDIAFTIEPGEAIDLLFIEERSIGVAPQIWWHLIAEDGRAGWYFVFSPGPSSSSLRTIPASETARAALTATPPTVTPEGP